MPELNLFLLGSPRAAIDGTPIDINRHKSIALLAYLALGDQEQHRDTLSAMFWPDSSQSRARASLRRDLSTLNKALGEDWLIVERDTIALQNTGLWIDVLQFRALLAKCHTHAHNPETICVDCLQLLSEAVSLYQNDFMTGFTLPDCPEFDEWQFFLTEELRQEIFFALRRLIQGYTTAGEFELALNYARRLLALDPLHEPTYQSLMILYAQTGQKSAALRLYQLCVQRFEEELDVPPLEETTAIYDEIRASNMVSDGIRENIFLIEQDLQQRRSELVNNLPVPVTPFVGREEGLVQLARLLDDPDCRLLTLIGPGGIGKTRLAIQAAQNLIFNSYGQDLVVDGVAFVRPIAASSLSQLTSAISEILEISSSPSEDVQNDLLSYLQEKRMLLVLDNFEHFLVDDFEANDRLSDVEGKLVGGTGLIVELLEAAAGIKIMVTSREALNLQGEWIYTVQGMRYPSAEDDGVKKWEEYSAVQLFEQGARRVRPNFSLEADKACVVKICHLVEGMPLALELAAAWLKVLSCAEIAQEIEIGLDVLVTSLRDVPIRHRSIRAVFESSYQMLSPREQEVLRCLSVIQGGFGQESAEKVAGASLSEITTLVEKSLLRPIKDGRIRMHALLRQYAFEKLEARPQEMQIALNRYKAYKAGNINHS